MRTAIALLSAGAGLMALPLGALAAPTCSSLYCMDQKGGDKCSPNGANPFELRQCSMPSSANSKVTTFAYVQFIDLSRSGSISFRAESTGNTRDKYSKFCQGKDADQPAPLLKKRDVADAFSSFKLDADLYKKIPMCVTNGQFFAGEPSYSPGTAPLALPVKSAGILISPGYESSWENKAEQVRSLQIYTTNRAQVVANPAKGTVALDKNPFCNGLRDSSAVITGFNPNIVDKNGKAVIGRTFVSVADYEAASSSYKKILVLSSSAMTQTDAKNMLMQLGADEKNILMLDGSGSSKLYCQRPGSGKPGHVFQPNDGRTIPQFIATSVMKSP